MAGTTPITGFDVLIVGGGPAGSAAARPLVQAGARVAVLDRARFPRVKLCAGWLSEPVWDVMELTPAEYTEGLWEWNRCHVHHRGRQHTIAARGWFIRRVEFDHFLLQRSGATVFEGTGVKKITRRDGRWVVNERFAAPYLIGAGGTHCPVARRLAPPRPAGPIGAQERELAFDLADVAARRLGGDGEPELLLHDDLRGYGWNVPKSEWCNVGVGTLDPKAVRDAWKVAQAHFSPHLPPQADEAFARMKGHSYLLYDPAHLAGCAQDGALLVGDALGLAHPFTAEGILPALLSGRLAGEAIRDQAPERYRPALQDHVVLQDYEALHGLRSAGAAIARRFPGLRASAPSSGPTKTDAAVARAFAWMFSGRRLPATRSLAWLVRQSTPHGRPKHPG